MKMHSQSKDNFNTTESLRTHVPWFSMEEFQHVYTTVFDDNPEIAREGYKYLLVWKARRSQMPPGVEATYNFCEVILQDGKFLDSSDELFLPQLRLMYATTIMRFLNLVLNTTEKKTLFHLADAVGIPKWIVDIRHDSAHGSVLPDIGVLRSAARFSMKWLRERYWEKASKMTDLITNDGELIISDYEQLIKVIFDCWENMAIFKLANLSTKKRIQPELWTQVNEIAASIKSKLHKPTQTVTEVDEALLVLNQKMKETLRNRRNHFVKPIFIKQMLLSESFLPSEEILSLFKAKSTNEDFPDALFTAWKEIMDNVWESGCISLLLAHLVAIAKDSNETALRRKFAGLWLQEILLSLIKVKESKRVLDDLVSQQRLSHLSDKTLLSAVGKAVVAQKPELHAAYNWACLPLPRCVLGIDLIEKCLTVPVLPSIHDVLPSLLQLLDPPLPYDMQDLLRECLAICGSRNNKKPTSDTFFTLANALQMETDVNEVPEVTSKMSVNTSLEDFVSTEHLLSQSSWKRSSDIFSWSRTALGILPWQCDDVTKVWRDLEVKNAWIKEDSKSNAGTINIKAK